LQPPPPSPCNRLQPSAALQPCCRLLPFAAVCNPAALQPCRLAAVCSPAAICSLAAVYKRLQPSAGWSAACCTLRAAPYGVEEAYSSRKRPRPPSLAPRSPLQEKRCRYRSNDGVLYFNTAFRDAIIRSAAVAFVGRVLKPACNYCLQLLLALAACNRCLQSLLAVAARSRCLQLLLAIAACNCCLQSLLGAPHPPPAPRQPCSRLQPSAAVQPCSTAALLPSAAVCCRLQPCSPAALRPAAVCSRLQSSAAICRLAGCMLHTPSGAIKSDRKLCGNRFVSQATAPQRCRHR
jgi:hypothetical protein